MAGYENEYANRYGRDGEGVVKEISRIVLLAEILVEESGLEESEAIAYRMEIAIQGLESGVSRIRRRFDKTRCHAVNGDVGGYLEA